MIEEVVKLFSEDEKILYEGKPDLKCFIMNSIFNETIIAIIVGAIFSTFIAWICFLVNPEYKESENLIIYLFSYAPFTGIPILIYLSQLLSSGFRYKNIYYCITNRGIYKTNGVFKKKVFMKKYHEIKSIDKHTGFINNLYNTGDINFYLENRFERREDNINICNVSNYLDIYNLIVNSKRNYNIDIMNTSK